MNEMMKSRAKELAKLIAIIVVGCFVSMSLFGCGYLDELKERRAADLGNGKIEYQDQTYVLLESSYGDVYLVLSKSISVVEEDVPLLLTEEFGHYAELSPDGKIMTMFSNVYAREDVAAAVAADLKTHAFDTFCYTIWTHDGLHVIKPAKPVCDALNAVLATTPVYEWFYENHSGTDIMWNGPLMLSDSECRLYKGYLEIYEDYSDASLWLQDSTTGRLYAVPEEYNDLLWDFVDEANQKGSELPTAPAAIEVVR